MLVWRTWSTNSTNFSSTISRPILYPPCFTATSLNLFLYRAKIELGISATVQVVDTLMEQVKQQEGKCRQTTVRPIMQFPEIFVYAP